MEQNYTLWVKDVLQLCVNAVQGENKLIKDKFAELAEEFLSFGPQEKQTVFELMENSLQNSMVSVYVYSCIIQYTELQEFEKPTMNQILLCDYDALSGCMIELQVMRVIKGCYMEKRSLHRKNAEKLRQAIGQKKSYIPVESRNSKRIVIVTEQIRSLLHAPTSIVFNIAYILKKYMQYEVFIFICPCNFLFSEEMWYHPEYTRPLGNVRSIDIEHKDEIFKGYQINMYSPDCINEYSRMLAMIQEWNPAFVLGLGVVNPVLDLVNDFTTVVAMAMSIDCPITDSEILFRAEKRGKEKEQEYAAALNPNQTQIFLGQKMPAIVEGQANGNYNRKELGLPLDKFVIVIVGNRLDKEIDLKFAELMKSVLTENPGSVFAVIGTVTEVQGYFEGTEYQNRVFYLGYCPDLLGTYGVMDLYLNPERTGGGWSSAMALMAKVPVVTLPDCDVAYNVGEKFIVSDYMEMKTVINRYMTDSDYMEEMKKYAAECGAENTEEKMIKYVQSMVDGINTVIVED